MSWLRHAGRHVHHTAANYLKDQLDTLGWTAADAEDRPWGLTQVELWTKPAVTDEGLVEAVRSGIVAITLGDEADSTLQEMSGPLATQDYPLFINVFHDTEESTLALATDIRDIFKGRLPDTNSSLPVLNQADQVAVPGWVMEFNDIERVRPDSGRIKLHWQVVKVTAETYFQEVRY